MPQKFFLYGSSVKNLLTITACLLVELSRKGLPALLNYALNRNNLALSSFISLWSFGDQNLKFFGE
jgi:hypothetical protein